MLFLGDRGHHVPSERVAEIKSAFGHKGLFITYTEKLTDLNPQNLSRYDGLMVYANIGNIEPAQEKAILDFVAAGKGYIPVHCASFCFQNSPELIALLGAQFKSHGTGVFHTRPVNRKHPVTENFAGFESWDERGRCWIAETRDYPNDMKITGEGKDSIKILEDTDGDGRCDKVKVFQTASSGLPRTGRTWSS